jgi:branched-chain amino acid transport system permease protein
MRRRIGPILLALAAVCLLALPLASPSTYVMRLVNMALIMSLLAISLNIVLGYAGLISLGHAGLFGIGAYTAALLTTGRSGALFAPAFLAAAAMGGLAGFLVGLPTLRLRGHYLALATLGFGEIVSSLLLNWRSLTLGNNGVGDIPPPIIGPVVFDSDAKFYWLLLPIVALALLLAWRLAASRIGLKLFALRDAETAAACAGVDVPRLKLFAFTVSAAMAGAAGALYAHLMAYISPDVFGFDVMAQLLSMVVIGGLGSVCGPVLGAFLLTFLPEVLRVSQAYYQILYGAGMIALVIFLPYGLIGRLARRRAAAGAMPDAAPAPVTRPHGVLLKIEGLTKRFGGVVAIDGFDMTVQAGTIHALIGPNGSGKSTFINLASGLYRPNAGRILLGGKPIGGARPWRIARSGLVRTFQNLRSFRTLTVLDNVRAGTADTAAAREALELVGLWPQRDRAVIALPHEQQRLVEIARCVAMRAPLILLDEPAAGMNPTEVDRLVDCLGKLRARGQTILLVEHNMPMVMRVADRITVLNFGQRIAEGTPEAIRRDPAVIAAYLGRRAARAEAVHAA